jgi:hypothetical protein
MSVATASTPTAAPALRDRATAERPDRHHQPRRSWVWTLVESLAYAGASTDPTAALAARRLARIRDEELRRGRGGGAG